MSAPAWRLRARDIWLGRTDAKRGANLQGIACNRRFLIRPGVRAKHLASHVLGRLVRRIGADWHTRTGIAPGLKRLCPRWAGNTAPMGGGRSESSISNVGRATPDMPRTAVFDDDQWKGIAVFLTRKPPLAGD